MPLLHSVCTWVCVKGGRARKSVHLHSQCCQWPMKVSSGRTIVTFLYPNLQLIQVKLSFLDFTAITLKGLIICIVDCICLKPLFYTQDLKTLAFSDWLETTIFRSWSTLLEKRKYPVKGYTMKEVFCALDVNGNEETQCWVSALRSAHLYKSSWFLKHTFCSLNF